MATKRVIVKDRGLNKILANLAELDGKRVAVGIQGPEAGAIHPDSELDNVTLGTIHEFGAPGAGIPERSFVRSTFDNRIREWTALLTKLAVRVYSTTPENPTRALGIFGEVVVSDIRKAMTAGIPPPLKAATVARKGSSTPLIDMGALLGSITSTVKG